MEPEVLHCLLKDLLSVREYLLFVLLRSVWRTWNYDATIYFPVNCKCNVTSPFGDCACILHSIMNFEICKIGIYKCNMLLMQKSSVFQICQKYNLQLLNFSDDQLDNLMIHRMISYVTSIIVKRNKYFISKYHSFECL